MFYILLYLLRVAQIHVAQGAGGGLQQLEVVRLVRERAPGGAEIIECEDAPVTLLDRWTGDDRVIVVDDVITTGGSTLKAIDAIEAEAAP